LAPVTGYPRDLVGYADTPPDPRWPGGARLALNFVIKGLLGKGVAASTRTDAQAKGLGEYLRAKIVEMPRELLGE